MFLTRKAGMLAVAACCSLASGAVAPEGWFLAGSHRADYDSGVDARAVYGGQPSAYLKSKKPEIEGFGTLMQNFNAAEYLGKRVRLSAFVKTEAVESWAGLWMRVDGPGEMLAFDNMQSRPIKGTTGWQNYEVVLNVDSKATGIAFGVLLQGTGTAWINSVRLDEVGTNIPTTELRKPVTPENLAMEGASAGPPRGWILAGSKPASYSVGVETDGGERTAFLKSKAPAIEGFGTLMQMLSAEQYLGKRIRLSASVRAEGVQEWAGLWMRVDKSRDAVAFDNMQDRAIKGTTGRQNYAVVLDVPQDASDIAFGILLAGTGAVHLNNVRVEVVGAEVATTGKPKLKAPTNLGFEK